VVGHLEHLEHFYALKLAKGVYRLLKQPKEYLVDLYEAQRLLGGEGAVTERPRVRLKERVFTSIPLLLPIQVLVVTEGLKLAPGDFLKRLLKRCLCLA
jgi:hypothetical protein